MNRIFYYFPFAYFVKTRLNTKAAILFHGYSEFLLGIIILIHSGLDPFNATTNFLLGYLAFISVYEIGYIINDCVSVRFEQNPRKRVKEFDPSNLLIAFWILIRIVFFLAITFVIHKQFSGQWWWFYLILVVVFFVHNILQSKQYRVFTFICLAFLRFYAPLFPFITMDFLLQTLNAVLLFYIFFRTITYLDSKGLLVIPSRASFDFKAAYYFFLLPVSITIAVLAESYFSLFVNLYFLIFWGTFYLAERVGIISGEKFKKS